MIGWILYPFSSVWFGITILALLFVYCSVGSAIPPFRQQPLLEMTEFEWFHWWPFDLLTALVVANLAIITIRHIPLRWEKAGVWIIHAGTITLILGSYTYFSQKVEGDTLVFRRSIAISPPGVGKTHRLIALPGSETTIATHDGDWSFAIQSTSTNWPLLSEGHEGQTAYAVNVLVTPPDGEAFIRQLLDNYPQFTEDIIPSKGRAIKSLGTRLVNDRLGMTLGFAPQSTFHIKDTWALHVREKGAIKWQQIPLAGLPRYHEHVDDAGSIFAVHKIESKPIDIPVPENAVSGEPHALVNENARITAYLPYATMQSQWVEGGSEINPIARMTITGPDGASQSATLVALDPAQSQLPGRAGALVYLKDPTQIEAISSSPEAELILQLIEEELQFSIPLNGTTVVGSEGAFTKIENTDYAYRIANFQDNLSTEAGLLSIAMVDVQSPKGQFRRMVASNDSMTRDLSADGITTDKALLDNNLNMAYRPAASPVVLVASLGVEPRILLHNRDGRFVDRTISVGESVEIHAGLRLTLEAYFERGIAKTRPFVVPPWSRERNMGVLKSMIRLSTGTANARREEWIPFSQFAFEDGQHVYGGRFPWSPITVICQDGREVEVLFSREKRPLPFAVSLDRFELQTHIGGFSGNANTIRDYVSHITFNEDESWSTPTEVSVNDPTQYRDYWFFQATWDPPPQGIPGSGMNYTGLGVGNREGVYVQLFGSCLMVLGMIVTFYVKPLLYVRRKRAKAGSRESTVESVLTPAEEARS